MTVFPLYHVLSVRASMSFMIPYERTLFHLTRLDQALSLAKGRWLSWLAKLSGF